MKLIPALLFCCAIALPSPAFAEKLVLVNGDGNDTCGAFNLSLTLNSTSDAITHKGQDYYSKAATYAQWVAGFVTAKNFSGDGAQAHIDFNQVMTWVTGYCKKNPRDTIAHAAEGYVRSHYRSKSKR